MYACVESLKAYSLPAQCVIILIFLSLDWCDTMVVKMWLFSDDNNIVAVAAAAVVALQ